MSDGTGTFATSPSNLTAEPSGKRRLAEFLMLALFVSVAAVLRFYDLSLRGFIYWDEAKFALEGIRLQALLAGDLGLRVSPFLGKTVGTAKPTSALLYAAGDAVFGDHDWSVLYINAAASVIQIPVVYILGRRLFGPVTGLLAALLLAVSEYEVVYARSGLTESDGSLLLLAAVTLYAWRCLNSGRASVVLLPSVILGLAFTANYRLIVYVAALALFDLIRRERSDGLSSVWRAAFVWGLGFVAFPLLWQFADIFARHAGVVLFRSEMSGRPMWYWQQVLYQIHQGKQSRVEFEPQLYVEWFVTRQGLWSLLLLLAGIIAALGRRSREILLVAALVVIPWAVYTFAPFVVPRNLEAAMPYVSLLEAAGLVMIVSAFGRLKIPALLAAALILSAVGFGMTWRLTAIRSGFAAAASYINAHADGRAITSTEVLVYYLRGEGRSCNAPTLPTTRAALARDRAAGYRYVVLDHHWKTLGAYISHHARLTAAYLAEGRVTLGESLIASENTHAPDATQNPEVVRVFAISSLSLPKADRRDVVCNRNRAT